MKSLLIVSLLCAGNGFAQPAGKDAAAIIEIGGAPSLSLSGDGWSFGPTIAVEVTPIEKRLELEMGVTTSFGHHSQEWDMDLLFKKPWTLSEKVEFMIGAGPVWIRTRKCSVTTNAAGGEAVLDFMFWPSAKRRLGWYLEPGYEYSFGRGHDRSVGISGGLLIAIR
ncbi:MAG TPA: hypothetical protein VMT15_07780 [Bryobacteraceae bacterium]|nr:hypothetical protein [Bryobacteraceae bacterium]